MIENCKKLLDIYNLWLVSMVTVLVVIFFTISYISLTYPASSLVLYPLMLFHPIIIIQHLTSSSKARYGEQPYKQHQHQNNSHQMLGLSLDISPFAETALQQIYISWQCSFRKAVHTLVYYFHTKCFWYNKNRAFRNLKIPA